MTPKKIYLSKLVMAGAEILDKPVSDSDVEYIRADVIRTEIERLKTVQLKRIQEGDLVDAEPYDKDEAYNELLDFLDTLESENPMNQKGLEREIERCLWKLSDDPSNEELRMFARNFYDLGCRHTAEKYDEIEYNRQRAEESVCKDFEKEIDFQTFSKEMGAVFALPKERTKNTEEEPLRWEYEIARHFAKWGAEHLANSNDEIVINGHMVAYNKNKDAITMEEIPNELEEAARHSEILTYPMPEDGDIKKVFEVQEARVFHEIGFIVGAKWQKEHDAELIEIAYNDGITIGMTKQKEQMMKEDYPKWRRIKAGERLPCPAYVWTIAYDNYPDCFEGRLMPNIQGVKVGRDTWYLPVDVIHNLPKDDEK